MQWFIILGSIDITTFLTGLSVKIAIPNPWNGMEIAFWTKKQLALFLTGTFPQVTSFPHPSATKLSMTVLTLLIWSNGKFQNTLSFYAYKMQWGQFWCFKYFSFSFISVEYCIKSPSNYPMNMFLFDIRQNPYNSNSDNSNSSLTRTKFLFPWSKFHWNLPR